MPNSIHRDPNRPSRHNERSNRRKPLRDMAWRRMAARHGADWSHEAWRRWPPGQGFARHHRKHHSGGALFSHFALAFGAMALLAISAMGVIAFAVSSVFGGVSSGLAYRAGSTIFAVLLVLLALRAGRLAFRRIASPLAEMMRVTDRVSDGDLTARVTTRSAGVFSDMVESLNHMLDELERSDRQRRNLTADVAHELRTPLQIIQGRLEGMIDGVYDADIASITAALEETQLLSRLIEDLRLLTLAETGQLTLNRQVLDMADLCADTVTSFGPLAEDLGVRLVLERSADRAYVRGDGQRLDQVLGNLVSNALRHTQPGGTVSVETEVSDDSVYIKVSDNGEGIAADDLSFIFDRFWRSDRSRSRTSGGSGLGLAISKQLVLAHGGRLLAESQPGQGSVFTIELPLLVHLPKDDTEQRPE